MFRRDTSVDSTQRQKKSDFVVSLWVCKQSLFEFASNLSPGSQHWESSWAAIRLIKAKGIIVAFLLFSSTYAFCCFLGRILHALHWVDRQSATVHLGRLNIGEQHDQFRLLTTLLRSYLHPSTTPLLDSDAAITICWAAALSRLQCCARRMVTIT